MGRDERRGSTPRLNLLSVSNFKGGNVRAAIHQRRIFDLDNRSYQTLIENGEKRIVAFPHFYIF